MTQRRKRRFAPHAGLASCYGLMSRLREGSAAHNTTGTDMITRGEIAGICAELLRSPALRLALMCVVPYACVLVGLDVAAHYGDATGAALPVQFFMSQDGSFAEFLEYSLTTASAVLLFVLWLRGRVLVFLTSAILFGWLTLDNWGEVHEQVGFALGPALPMMPWLPVQPHHLAETLVFGTVGLLWLAGMAAALHQADTRAAVYGMLIALCIAGAAVFGIVVDLGTSWGEHGPAVLNLLAFIEDEGEFAMILVMFALCVGIYDVETRRMKQSAGHMQHGQMLKA
jgi:hypothetical protein